MLYLLTLHRLWFFCRCAIDPIPSKRQKVNVYKLVYILFFPNTLILLSICKSAVLHIVNRIEFSRTWKGLITYARQSPWMYRVGCPRMWHRLYTIAFLWFWKNTANSPLKQQKNITHTHKPQNKMDQPKNVSSKKTQKLKTNQRSKEIEIIYSSGGCSI